ncbi:MAG TPA: hypothetical protein VKT82_28835 [Ktedonobacterales bacterium]|nr:hypothetical protein [Ktedonobacterales bacterium]
MMFLPIGSLSMKNPRIEDFDPNAKAHQLKSPLEGMPAIEIPSRSEKARKTAKPQAVKPAKPQTHLPESPKEVLPSNLQDVLPAKPQTVKPVNPFTRLPENTHVEKYTTRLEPSLIKQIKQFAVDQDIKDYEVVQQAVKEYLAKKR